MTVSILVVDDEEVVRNLMVDTLSGTGYHVSFASSAEDAIAQASVSAFDLVLSGHTHDGQICVPFPGGKLRLAHLGAAYTAGLYRRPSGVLHVSPGLGTTFVPFRFLARPEATELVLLTPLAADGSRAAEPRSADG